MKLRNFTPHEINLYDETGTQIIETFPSEGNIRMEEKIVDEYTVADGQYKVVTKKYVPAELPAMEDDTMIIVSLLVAQNCHQEDMLCPDTGINSVVRNDRGQIIGVRNFQKIN
uniref:Uncharacterized protein n=1 Tax=viral metagenome TaxID=1070528 RepID=A0A6H1ZN64_9ZZZZ